MAFLDVRHFSYTYPGAAEPALRHINLEIEQGSFVVLTGKSGCGKSTLGKALAGFLFQDDSPNYTGEITVNSVQMDEVPLFAASERVAYVQQNPEDQFCTLTVLDEIAFGLENRRVAPQEIDRQIREALEIVNGLNLIDRTLASLSGGEKQKVAIASMLALTPDVLILDEPTSNLDPISTQIVFSALHQLRQSGEITVIIIEHKLSQLMALDPEWIVMEQGQIRPDLSTREHIEISQGSINLNKPENTSGLDISPDEPVVQLSNVSFRRRNLSILSDIALNLYPGEFVSLMGPNGSGKSTLLRAIMGLLSPLEGIRKVFGKVNGKARVSELVPHTGFLFQNPDHMLFTQSVWDETIFTARNLKALPPEREKEALSSLDRLGLADRQTLHPNRLSYGEKRRLNLVSILLHHPGLLLIDELLIGQDLENARTWMATLAEYAAEGNAVLLVNHHPELTEAFCDRVVMLDKGQKIIDAPVKEAFGEMERLGMAAFLPAKRKAAFYA